MTDTSAPFPHDSLEFMVHMTREEWQLVYGLSFAWTVTREMPGLPLGQSFRWVIQKLAREHDYEWRGLRVDDRGGLWARSEEPVCSNNLMFISLIRRGGTPDLEVHLRAALTFIEDHRLGVNVEPIHELLAKARRDAEKVSQNTRNLSESEKREAREALAERSRVFQSVNGEGMVH